MDRKKSRYTRDDRKHIVESIENLKNNEDYVAIFEILTDDTANSYTQNSNGVFLNLSAVSDDTLDSISKYLNKVNKNRTEKIEIDVDIIPNAANAKSDRTYKLSNYEKNILKQRNLKKVLNDDEDYQELTMTSTKTKKLSPIKSTKSVKSVKTTKKSKKAEAY
jgi:hypothetical protein